MNLGGDHVVELNPPGRDRGTARACDFRRRAGTGETIEMTPAEVSIILGVPLWPAFPIAVASFALLETA
jgi:hypothetical protein